MKIAPFDERTTSDQNDFGFFYFKIFKKPVLLRTFVKHKI